MPLAQLGKFFRFLFKSKSTRPRHPKHCSIDVKELDPIKIHFSLTYFKSWLSSPRQIEKQWKWAQQVFNKTKSSVFIKKLVNGNRKS